MIAEVNVSGNTLREYVWLPETEIAPSRQGRAQVDRPIAAITGVNTASPATLYVHVDHLNRPVSMTNASKASVWDAVWTPWGAPYSIIGSETLDARFPGQWFQLEAGLNYNWHRHYDPTTGRYTQPDPLGFVDGPSVYAYGRNSPQRFVDKDGRFFPGEPPPVIAGEIALDLFLWMTLPEPQPLDALRSRRRNGGGGGSGKNGGPQCSDDDRCDKQLEDDLKWCGGSVILLYGKSAYGACKASAFERYAECLRGGPVRTKLYGRDVH